MDSRQTGRQSIRRPVKTWGTQHRLAVQSPSAAESHLAKAHTELSYIDYSEVVSALQRQATSTAYRPAELEKTP